jgi:hypothetical protein
MVSLEKYMSVPLIRVEFAVNVFFHKRQESFDLGVTLIKVGGGGGAAVLSFQ